jgi:sugar O-acyltransferase (sialic acid O-acetyltransferase NeuD family)
MSEAKQLLIPLLNPNETEALVAGLHVSEGQKVKAGDLLYTLETTKSTSEVEAEEAGYLVGIQIAEGQTVSAGSLFAYLAGSPDWKPPQAKEVKPAKKGSEDLPDGLRITEPALALARQNSLDLSQLPVGPLVTEDTVRGVLGQGLQEGADLVEGEYDPSKIIVYGGGGHGKSVIDLLLSLGVYQVVGVIDDGLAAGDEILGIPVLGGGKVLGKLHAERTHLAVNAVGGIGDVGSRVKVFNRLAGAGFTCPAIVHPTAFVEVSAALSPGVQVFPHAYVGSDVQAGFGTIVNTGAIVSHDCVLGKTVNIAPGAILAGGVRIGDLSLIGMGVTINLNVNVGERSQIGNGATIKADVPDGGIVRAGTIWPK